MSLSWRSVPLGQVLQQRKEFITIDDLESYKRPRVQLHAQGVVLRDIVQGAEIKTKEQQVCRAGEFLVAEIDAKVGGYGLVLPELEGAIVSSHYFLFEADEAKLDRRFLAWYVRTPAFADQITAKGSTNYAAIRPADVLRYSMPLPPLDEQRRIVARIEELAARIEEARGLRRGVTESAEQLIPSALHDTFETKAANWKRLPMSEAIEVSDRQVDPTLPEFARLPHISGENIESKTCRLLPYRTAEQDGVRSGNYHFSPGTVLYSKIRPYLRKATLVDFGGVCSADIYPLRVINPQVNLRFMMWSMVAGPFTTYANQLSGRTRMPKLNRKQLFGFNLAYPDMQEQGRIVAYLDDLQARIDALKRLQVETAAELDALLPSVLDRAFRGEL
jgi:type I restriction enzyme, S subunit